MKVLIFSGTPKKDGITHSLVQTAEDTAKQLGMDAEVIRLADENLTNCKMCDDGWGLCNKEYRCAFENEDGFALLQEKVRTADAYIYITPVYWGDVSECMKPFFDKLRRTQATKQWEKDKDKNVASFLKGKPSIIVANAGGSGGGLLPALTGMERAISHMGGDSWPKNTGGILDIIAVNRWNHHYKYDSLKAAITEMHCRLVESGKV